MRRASPSLVQEYFGIEELAVVVVVVADTAAVDIVGLVVADTVAGTDLADIVVAPAADHIHNPCHLCLRMRRHR